MAIMYLYVIIWLCNLYFVTLVMTYIRYGEKNSYIP